MRLVRLAKLFEHKYNFKSEASPLQEIVNRVKNDLINAYSLYVNSDTAKEPVLQMLAQAGEPFSKGLISGIEELIANIDTLTPVQLFNRVNKVLAVINDIKKDPEKKVRTFIHDSVRVNKESERNYRERLKSKFEMILFRLSSIFEKQAKILQKFLPKETPLAGGVENPQRKELSKEKLLVFMRTPAAQSYGLDNIDIMTKVLSYNDLKDKLTTLVNAIDRGHIPIDGPEVRQATQEIAEALKIKETNAEQFGEEKE